MTIHEITARHITLRVTSHPTLSHHTASHDIASHDGTSHHMRGMAHLSFLPGTQFRLARSEPLRNARRLHVQERGLHPVYPGRHHLYWCVQVMTQTTVTRAQPSMRASPGQGKSDCLVGVVLKNAPCQ